MSKYGLHDDDLKAKNLTLTKNLTITGDITFGDASTDTLTCTGLIAANGGVTVGTNKKLSIRSTRNYMYSSAVGVTEWVSATSAAITAPVMTITPSNLLTVVGTARFSTSRELQFRQATNTIHSPAVGQLHIEAATSCTVTSPTITLAPTTLSISGNVAVGTDKQIQLRQATNYLDSNAVGAMRIAAATSCSITSPTITLAPTTLSVTGNLAMGTDKQVQLRQTTNYIDSDAIGAMRIAAATSCTITAPTVTITPSTQLNLNGDLITLTDKKLMLRQNTNYLYSEAVGAVSLVAATSCAITAPAVNITGDVTMVTDDKVQLRQATNYLNSPAVGQIAIAAATSCSITAPTVSVTGDFSYSGHKNSQLMLFNAIRPVSATGWAVAADGSYTLAKAKTNSTAIVPLTGLKFGDEITSFKIAGAISATAGTAIGINASLRRNLRAAGAVTDAAVVAMPYVTATADLALYHGTTFAAHTVASTYQYYVLVAATTGDSDGCSLALTGVEVRVNRK